MTNNPKPTMTAEEIVYGTIREYSPRQMQAEGYQPLVADEAIDELKRAVRASKTHQSELARQRQTLG